MSFSHLSNVSIPSPLTLALGAMTQGSVLFAGASGVVSQNNSALSWTDSTGTLALAPAARTSGSPSLLTITGPADTTLAASTEAIDVKLNLARTVQFATGALTTQRALLVQAPTYGFVAASTLTTAATVEITGAPIAGTNATITNAYGLRVLAGQATAVPVVVKAAASQSANMQEWQNSTGTVSLYVNSGGHLVGAGVTARFQYFTDGSNNKGYIDTSVAGANFVVNNRVTTNIPVVIKAVSSQTADLQEWQDSTGAVLGLVNANGDQTIQSAVRTSGSPTLFTVTGPAHTALTASTESIDTNFNLARTVQFATGALTTQRAALFQAPSYGFVGTSTLTDAATVAITGAPKSQTNATITNSHGLLVQTGAVQPAGTVTNSYGLSVNAGTGATNNYAAQFIGGNVGIGMATPAAKLDITVGTITTSLPSVNSSATWNAATVTFQHNLSNVTDTASHQESTLLEIQVGGSTRFAVQKSGRPCYVKTMCYEEDDFNGGNTTSGTIGNLDWTSTGTITNVAATASHPGVIRIDTGASADTVAAIFIPGTAARCFLPADNFDIIWIIKLGQTGSGMTIRVGATTGAVGTAAPTDGIYFEYLGASDTDWFGITRASSTQTRTDTSSAASTSFVRLRLRRKDASTIAFSVNGGTEVTATANIATVVLNPWCMITNPSTSASKTVDVDFFDLLVNGMNR